AETRDACAAASDGLPPLLGLWKSRLPLIVVPVLAGLHRHSLLRGGGPPGGGSGGAGLQACEAPQRLLELHLELPNELARHDTAVLVEDGRDLGVLSPDSADRHLHTSERSSERCRHAARASAPAAAPSAPRRRHGRHLRSADRGDGCPQQPLGRTRQPHSLERVTGGQDAPGFAETLAERRSATRGGGRKANFRSNGIQLTGLLYAPACEGRMADLLRPARRRAPLPNEQMPGAARAVAVASWDDLVLEAARFAGMAHAVPARARAALVRIAPAVAVAVAVAVACAAAVTVAALAAVAVARVVAVIAAEAAAVVGTTAVAWPRDCERESAELARWTDLPALLRDFPDRAMARSVVRTVAFRDGQESRCQLRPGIAGARPGRRPDRAQQCCLHDHQIMFLPAQRQGHCQAMACPALQLGLPARDLIS
ncbi:unnamed protein product, partial [Prorocentrum cordatum]